MKKTAFYILGLLFGLIILVMAQTPTRSARMVVCDVGQGDAILITKGSNQVLIDGGPSGEKMLSCLTEHMPFWDRNIELIVLTNTDYDHMNGLSAVLERYTLTSFVSSDGVHESAALGRFVDRLVASGASIRGVQMGDKIEVGERDRLTFDVLWPPEVESEYVAVFEGQMDSPTSSQILGASAKRGDLNERSVVLLLLEDNKRVLLTGDVGFQAEEEILRQAQNKLDLDVDVLKVGHHGSKYASGLEFLEAIKPEMAIISVGAKNRYGHPTSEAIERLEEVGAEVRRTDEEGTLVIEL